MRRALERFNESEAARVVGGLIRSLGEPSASVESLSARPPRVAITVAWELSWYRWEVMDSGEEITVREVAKGDSLAELTESAKSWNATADAEGNLHLTLAEAQEAGDRAVE